MDIKLCQTKIYRKEIIFLLSYVCFYTSLFLSDVAIEINTDKLTRGLRYISYLLALIQLAMYKDKNKHFVVEIAVLVITLIFFIRTNDIYLPMLVILIIGAKDSSEEHICNISLKLIIIGTILTFVGGLIGYLPDIMTSKAFSTDLTRHSYGFYHSNVLPNNILLIEILAVWKYKEKMSNFTIIFFLILHILIYFPTCSRMSLMVGILITLVLIALKTRFFKINVRKIIIMIAYFITQFYTLVSVILMLLVNTNSIANRVDLFFSNRFWIAFLKVNRVGIKLFNFSSNDFFYKDKLVIDSGYLFLLLRYGIIALLAINIISTIMVKKNINQMYHLLCIITIFTIAFIDNLFLSYRFLPFLMFSFIKRSKRFNDERKKKIVI